MLMPENDVISMGGDHRLVFEIFVKMNKISCSKTIFWVVFIQECRSAFKSESMKNNTNQGR